MQFKTNKTVIETADENDESEELLINKKLRVS